MERRSVGFVGRYLTMMDAASYVEWPRAQMVEAIEYGMIPAVRLRSGEWIVLASAVAGLGKRLCEY